LEALIPEFAGLARETTLLYPRSGSPGVHESSMGGPLLWPAGEPWPYSGRSVITASVPFALRYHDETATRLVTEAGGTWSRYAPGDHSR
jgi:hypothetical protein